MKINIRNINYERFFVFVIAFLSFLVQMTKMYIFSPKYFYDAKDVFEHMGGDSLFNIGDSYEIAYFLFGKVQKLVPFLTMQQWNVTIWIILGLPTLVLVYKKIIKYNKSNIFFWGMCLGYMMLLPIFCWNTQKEAIQYIISALLLGCVECCEMRANKTKRCIVMVGSLLLAWGIAFRSYYLLITCLFLLFAILLCGLWEQFTGEVIHKVTLGIIFLIIGIFIYVYCCKTYMLYWVFDARMSVNYDRIGSEDAKTIILDWIENQQGSLLIHFINYFINALRLLFPIELFFWGKKYIVYIVLQLILSTMVILGVRDFCHVIKNKLNHKKDSIPIKIKILLSIMLAWYMVAFVFEPDFGSFLRHQVAMFPAFCPIYCSVLERWNTITGISRFSIGGATK